MSQINLNLKYTHSFLIDNAKAIQALLTEEELDESELLALVEEREQLIQHYLSETPQSEWDKAFLRAEADNNTLITNKIVELQKQTASQLRVVVRGRKAIKQYR
ncbi:hypothetical protein C2869_15790 [Saccharobesus litoralis]|uniref:Flagellar protein FliT n=1 Tax=Saccharobesus litoralis TaxID=2172099 RepID=A0A2S0VUA1_9ALTE|nr:hypothetical protein [Saccharobesus litoralis]AWB67797.1 hypothetical protein C2869_15790 [Saccharobesus litoralis]